ncbi:unnamed protein product, partial [Prorocentrum cordatum]
REVRRAELAREVGRAGARPQRQRAAADGRACGPPRAGRAGQRGPQLPPRHHAGLARDKLTSGAEPLQSNFQPSYQMLCALLQAWTPRQLKATVRGSFAAFLGALEAEAGPSTTPWRSCRERGLRMRRMAAARELRGLRAQLGSFEQASQVEEYARLAADVRKLEHQLELERGRQACSAALFKQLGEQLGDGDLDESDGLVKVFRNLSEMKEETEDLSQEEAALEQAREALRGHPLHDSPEVRRLAEAADRRRELRRR